MKIRFGKILHKLSKIILTRSVSQEDNKYYPQVYLHECLHEICEWTIKSVQSLYNIHNISHIFQD